MYREAYRPCSSQLDPSSGQLHKRADAQIGVEHVSIKILNIAIWYAINLNLFFHRMWLRAMISWWRLSALFAAQVNTAAVTGS